MPDAINPIERRLIEEALKAGRVQVIKARPVEEIVAAGPKDRGGALEGLHWKDRRDIVFAHRRRVAAIQAANAREQAQLKAEAEARRAAAAPASAPLPAPSPAPLPAPVAAPRPEPRAKAPETAPEKAPRAEKAPRVAPSEAPRRRAGPTKSQRLRAQYAALCDGSRTLAEVAEAMGVPVTTAHSAVKRYGLAGKIRRLTGSERMAAALTASAGQRREDGRARYEAIVDGTRTAAEVAAALGVSRSVVYKMCGIYGLRDRLKPDTSGLDGVAEQRRETARARWAAVVDGSRTAADVAAVLGVSTSLVYRKCALYGLKDRLVPALVPTRPEPAAEPSAGQADTPIPAPVACSCADAVRHLAGALGVLTGLARQAGAGPLARRGLRDVEAAIAAALAALEAVPPSERGETA